MIYRRLYFSALGVVCLATLLVSSTVDAAMQFTLPRTEVIVCTDSIDNVCTAPTSCNANGSAKFDPGNNLHVGTAEQRNGVWTIVGGYTISFPSQCDITCQGDCTCEKCTSKVTVANFANKSPGAGGGSGSSTLQAASAVPMLALVIGWLALLQ
jgi:hypothetical protein